jgi:hypothetical protein
MLPQNAILSWKISAEIVGLNLEFFSFPFITYCILVIKIFFLYKFTLHGGGRHFLSKLAVKICPVLATLYKVVQKENKLVEGGQPYTKYIIVIVNFILQVEDIFVMTGG